jgi:hypothetical protein
MHINHMAAYTGKKPIGTPHDRFCEAPGPRWRSAGTGSVTSSASSAASGPPTPPRTTRYGTSCTA